MTSRHKSVLAKELWCLRRLWSPAMLLSTRQHRRQETCSAKVPDTHRQGVPNTCSTFSGVLSAQTR